MTPSWVAALLEARLFRLAARTLMALVFLVPGVMQAVQFQGALGEFSHFGLQPPAAFVALSVITLLTGSVLLIMGGKRTWLGAGALGIYLGLTVFIVHHFWTMSGDQGLSEFREVMSHIGLIGGLMAIAILEHDKTA